jgi:hypothetical protein
MEDPKDRRMPSAGNPQHERVDDPGGGSDQPPGAAWCRRGVDLAMTVVTCASLVVLAWWSLLDPAGLADAQEFPELPALTGALHRSVPERPDRRVDQLVIA